MCNVVQDFMEDAAIAFCSHSLAAERAAAEVKRHETTNITLLGNVSLNLLCRRFNARRSEDDKQLEKASEELRKLKRSGWKAIAWEKHEAYPQGVRSTCDTPIRRSRLATGGVSAFSGEKPRRPKIPLAASSRSRSPAGLSSSIFEEMCKAERHKRIQAAAVNF